ncbi:MAG: hypothetical protein LBK47_02130 [Prevotellaceae bacterium]|jgi:hypothetical protein|nr:hypothetical protein [Prevotellaceae bacterium]
MKSPSKNLVRVVAATTIVGMLAPSCETLVYKDVIVSDSLPAKGAYAIDLDLTKGELDYLRFLQKLSDDIVKYPVIAREFAKNPQLFLEKYGYNEPIDMDENMMKLVLTLGDDDINKAVNVGDIKMVLKLMDEKNLLSDYTNSYSNVNFPEEQVKEIMGIMGINASDIECYSCGPAICVAILLLAAVVYVGAATIAAVGVAVGVVFALSIGGTPFLKNPYTLPSNTSLKIWSLKGKPDAMYIAADLCIEDQVDKIMDVIKSYSNKSNVKNFDEKKMREFLKLNILMQNN